jgi:acetylxylan esterase
MFSISQMPARSRYAAAILHLATLSLGASPAFAAWADVDYGNGAANPKMTLYTPTSPDASPGVIVSLHYCTGTAQNAQGWFQQLADQHGFLVIAPDVGPGNCWNADPKRAGEPAAIVEMVNHVIENNSADPARIFAAGASSGGCMSEALIAAYPDVFAGAAALAGVPAGAWTGGNDCNICNQAAPNRTAMQWGDEVRGAGPQGFAGPWPRFLLIHGTNDPILQGSTMIPAQTAQWTNVLGLTDADATSENNQPISGWTRKSYKDDSGIVVFEVSTGTATSQNQHDLTDKPAFFTDVVRFFGLDMDPPVGSGGTGGGTGGGGAGTGGLAGGGSANGGGSAGGTAGASSGGGGTGGATSSGGTATTSGGASSSGGAGTAGASGGAPAGAGGASTTPGGETTDNGCGCRVAGAGSGALGGLAMLAAGLGLLLRRKQRTGAKRD